KLVQACKKHVRALADELTLQEIDAIEAGLRDLDSLDSATESLLAKMRRLLKATQSSARRPVVEDPWASSEDAMLRRLAEQPSYEAPVRARAAEVPNSAALREAEQVIFGEASPSEASSATGEASDLWSLWSQADESSSSSGRRSKESKVTASGVQDAAVGFLPGEGAVGSATPPSRLKDYLSRPERVGRRTVVLPSSGSK
ncbi:unnamed protein product, partial [Polarella glacialis]